MKYCEDCGKPTSTSWGDYDGAALCWECYKKRNQAKIIENSKSVKSCSDFKSWDHGDLSELFWIHLGIYVKFPNKYSLSVMRKAEMWAHHDSHALSNAFYNALKWCGLNLYKESKRTDLPDKPPEEVLKC